MKEPERHSDPKRNSILNRALTDLDRIINEHDPEVDTSINNGVWDRLDKMALEIEAHAAAKRTAVMYDTLNAEQKAWLDTLVTFDTDGGILTVWGDVSGSVWGNVRGSVLGNVGGSVFGDVLSNNTKETTE